MPKSDISTSLTESNNFLTSFFNLSESDIGKCSMFNLKLVLFVILILILVCSLTSSLTSIFTDTPTSTEQFSNDNLYSYKDTVKANYSNYQSTALTAPETQEGNPSNLLFGQANRTVSLNQDGSKSLFLEIFCNLYVINGSPFGETKQPLQKYKVNIKKGNTIEPFGELVKNSDGIYKLKFKTDNDDQIQKLLAFNEIQITYTINDVSNVILSGKFTLV
jgi:hypothetical protein